MPVLSEKKLNKASRLDKAVKEYFSSHPSVTNEIPAGELMPFFIEKGIFLKDSKKGHPVRLFLRQLDKAGQLHLIKFAKAEGNGSQQRWYFSRIIV